MSDEQAHGELVTSSAESVDVDDLAQQLVASAVERQVALTGEGGLLTTLTRRVLQAALKAEMSAHLGYDKHAVNGRDGGNSRNGSSPKTVRTEIGDADPGSAGSGRHVRTADRAQAPAPPGRVR